MPYTFESQTGQEYYERCLYFQRILMEGGLKFKDRWEREKAHPNRNGTRDIFFLQNCNKGKPQKMICPY